MPAAHAESLPGAHISAAPQNIQQAADYPGIQHLHYKYGPINISPGQNTIEAKVNELDKKQTVLLHCGSGGRSTKALETFKKLGFDKVIHLDGGFTAYDEAREAARK